MRIGPYPLQNAVILAPMAGVTDLPFRQLCRRMGAGLAVSEMVSSDPRLWQSRKSMQRTSHDGEPAPVAVQIAGTDPAMLAETARYNVANGAQIIDINMGCPAKKVCNVMAGSALLKDEPLVARILEAVVGAVDVPVTLKIRTGWDRDHKNAVAVARIAEASGIQALAVHGRTRADAYNGEAEYDTIRAVKAAVSIPVSANGDIDSPEKAARVLRHTGADAVMIGRAAFGQPWLFRAVAHYLATGERLPAPTLDEARAVVLGHIAELHAFYGEFMGVRIARKHVGWYLGRLPYGDACRREVNAIEGAAQQLAAVERFLDGLAGRLDRVDDPWPRDALLAG